MLRATLICLFVIVGQRGGTTVPQGEPPRGTLPRPYHELDRETRDLLRQESRAATEKERAVAALAMIRLYDEIHQDSRLAGSPTLNRYRVRLAARLRRIAEDIRNRERSAEKRSEVAADAVNATVVSRPVTPSPPGSPGDPASRQGGGGPFPAMGGGLGLPDWGPRLAALIERTIAPESWDSRGGPGTVYYYRPQRALVVRATNEVHDEIAALLTALRAAGP